MMKNSKIMNLFKVILCLTISAGLVILDQVTKALAVANLKGQPDIILIPKAFQLHYLENYGMAFGMLQNQQIFFYIMTAVILIACLVVLYRMPVKKRFLPALIVMVMIIAGAVGNLIDRATTKYVVDFLYFSLIDFPVFNVADCYVTVSCAVFILLILFFYKEEELREILSFKKAENTTKTENPAKTDNGAGAEGVAKADEAVTAAADDAVKPETAAEAAVDGENKE